MKFFKSNIRLSFLIVLVAAFGFSCEQKEPSDLTKVSLIPIPISVEATGERFEITEKTVVYVSDDIELSKIGEYFADRIKPSTGLDIKIESVDDAPESGIYFNTSSANTLLGDEGYELEISEDLTVISSLAPAGVFRGVQTLMQLLPANIEASSIQSDAWEIATGKIVDYPEYEFRGSMLDVARHFFSVADVKRYIDLIAAYKMNILHIHLTDDQGWRIEIKSWPKLTTHGGKTEVGGDEGGFYTQEEYKEIVQYAADRYVTIIPEIDMPGHTNAALASYPELYCKEKPSMTETMTVDSELTYETVDGTVIPQLYTGTQVGFSTLCIDSDDTYRFVDDVIRELSAITPGPYIHLGGDETHVTPVEDYIPFFNKVQQMVLANGKRMIGWDEVAHAKLDKSSIVQYWNRADNTIKGVKQGAKVVMSPARKAYLDMQYDSTSRLGLHWAAYIEVDNAYTWDPATIEKDIPKEVILGIEAPLWSETIDSMDDIEYLMFPRIMGYAEIGWSSESLRNWETYKVRLGNQSKRLKAMEVDYYSSKLVPWTE